MVGDDVACVHNKAVVDAIGTRAMQRVGSRRRELGNSRDRQEPFTTAWVEDMYGGPGVGQLGEGQYM